MLTVEWLCQPPWRMCKCIWVWR